MGRLLGVAPRSVEYWVQRFEERGFGGLIEATRPGRSRHLREAQPQEVEEARCCVPSAVGLSATPWDGEMLQAWLVGCHRFQLDVRQSQRMSRQLGFRLCEQRARWLPTPIRCCRGRIKKLQVLSLETALNRRATDEVHFQQYGSRCRMRVRPETKDPVLPHHPTRRSVGYFGAVRLRDGKFFFQREAERFNAVTCWRFLQHLRAAST